jgi:hypothetical protein
MAANKASLQPISLFALRAMYALKCPINQLMSYKNIDQKLRLSL